MALGITPARGDWEYRRFSAFTTLAAGQWQKGDLVGMSGPGRLPSLLTSSNFSTFLGVAMNDSLNSLPVGTCVLGIPRPGCTAYVDLLTTEAASGMSFGQAGSIDDCRYIAAACLESGIRVHIGGAARPSINDAAHAQLAISVLGIMMLVITFAVVLAVNQIPMFGGNASAVLDNVDNRISGAGHLGNGQMTLHNEGTIDATGSNALVIETGTNAIVSNGILRASGTGGLVVDSSVTGAGAAQIGNNSTLEFAAAADVKVSFDAGGAGTLKLDQTAAFSDLQALLTAAVPIGSFRLHTKLLRF